MTKYSYQIHQYTNNLGEIYDEQGKWYNQLDSCENNIIKKLNGKNFQKELYDNYEVSCYLDIYIITDDCITEEQEETYNYYYMKDRYKIIKKIEKLVFYCGFEKPICIENFVIL